MGTTDKPISNITVIYNNNYIESDYVFTVTSNAKILGSNI